MRTTTFRSKYSICQRTNYQLSTAIFSNKTGCNSCVLFVYLLCIVYVLFVYLLCIVCVLLCFFLNRNSWSHNCFYNYCRLNAGLLLCFSLNYGRLSRLMRC